MVLYLDSAQRDRTIVALLRDGTVAAVWRWGGGGRPTVSIPQLLAKALRRRRQPSFTAVVVAERASVPARAATFSRLRAGVVCANAVAYACLLPLVGVPSLEPQVLAVQVKRRLRQAKRAAVVLPRYHHPPNITTR